MSAKLEIDNRKEMTRMKTVTLTAEEIRMLEIQFMANPCRAGCPLDRTPRLPKVNGIAQCHAYNKKGEYICPFLRAISSIEEKLGFYERK